MNQLIENIAELSVAKFNDCICDQKLSVLVISGEPSDVDLLECWTNLYAQYLDILGDAETLYILTIQKEAELLNHQIVLTEAMIRILKTGVHVDEFVKRLKDFGNDVSNLKQGNPGYDHSLIVIGARLAPLKLQRDGKAIEVENYYRDQKMDKISREYVSTQKARLSKYQGYPINEKETMVPEYVAILKDYLSIKNKQDGKQQERENR